MLGLLRIVINISIFAMMFLVAGQLVLLLLRLFQLLLDNGDDDCDCNED